LSTALIYVIIIKNNKIIKEQVAKMKVLEQGIKVICQGKELSDALSRVVKALPVKNTNPIYDGVKITAEGETLTLFATDLSLAIEKKINATVLLEGEVVVPCKLFADYAKKLEDEQVELDGSLDSSKLKIKYLDSELQIKTLPVEEYPNFTEIDTENSFVILKAEFKDIINKVLFAVASDDGRPSLRGVCLDIKQEEVAAVASDGYRLAKATAIIKNNGVVDKIVVPAKSIKELSSLIDDGEESITVYVDKNHIMVDLFHTKIVSRLIGETFLDYDKIIQKSFETVVTVDKKAFENAIERASLINRIDRKAFVKLDVRENEIMINSHSEDGEVNEKIPCSLNGKDIIIAYNVKYFTDCLHVIDEQFITLNFNASTAPGVITSPDGNWLFFLLPIRVLS